MKTTAALALACLLSSTLPATAESLNYKIVGGQFATSEDLVPAACIGKMMTRLNGDNFIAAIYLNRNSMRGCIDSNYAADSSLKERYTYKIQSETAPHTYNLVVCEKVEGSLGKSCEKMTVRFTSIPYISNKQTRIITALEKLGEWEIDL